MEDGGPSLLTGHNFSSSLKSQRNHIQLRDKNKNIIRKQVSDSIADWMTYWIDQLVNWLGCRETKKADACSCWNIIREILNEWMADKTEKVVGRPNNQKQLLKYDRW